MLAHDYDRFAAVLRKLETIYGKKISDDLVQVFWAALRDLPFEQVQERVNSHVRYAKFFPKPVELRPKEDRPKDKPDDSAFREASRAADEGLDRLWHEDRKRWLEVVSPKIYELGRAKGLFDSQIAQKLTDYRPAK